MIINEEMKSVIEGTAFLSIITMNADGTPHPIVTGKGEVSGDTIVFGIYKMDKTQENLNMNPNTWVIAATKDGKPKGYRLSGVAKVNEKKLIFTPSQAEALI